MKNILITGSSSGFGKEMVESLAKNGYKVFASMRNTSSRDQIFSHLPQQVQSNIRLIELDVTKKSDLEKVFQEIDKECPAGLDALINNAGYGAYGSLEETSEDQLRAQMEVNFFGLSLLIQELLPLLRKSQGRIINITSYMGQFSIPLGSIYSASKFAVEGLTEGLYYDWLP